MKILVLLCAAIMLAGCSEEKSTGDPKIDQALKDAVHFDSLATGDWTGRFYQNNEPYSGWAIRTDRWGVAALLQFKDGKMNGLSTQWHENGQKKGEATFKDGKIDGLATGWHENGQKAAEATYKDGEEVSGKYWNSKGEEVESLDEAEE